MKRDDSAHEALQITTAAPPRRPSTDSMDSALFSHAKLKGHRLDRASTSSSDGECEHDSTAPSVLSNSVDTPVAYTLSPSALDAVAQHSHRGATADLLLRCVNRCDGDEAAAIAAMIATLDWRASNGIDHLLHEPQPHFATIKAAYQHGVHCRARDGTPVFVEHVGRFRTAYGTLRKQGITDADFLRHMMFTNEYLYTVTAPGVLPGGRIIKILDMAGASIGDIRGAAHRFSKELGTINQAHYKDRLSAAYLINTPSWWGMAWKVVSHLFDPNVRAKIQVLGGHTPTLRARLADVLHEEDIPAAYGGPCVRALYKSADELALQEHVQRVGGGRATGLACTEVEDESGS